MDVKTLYENTAFQSNPGEEKLRYECKQALKSRIFRGYYLERRYEEAISAYRDIVVLQKSETDLEQLLIDVKCKLSMYYANINVVRMWIGITNDTIMSQNVDTLKTCIWTNLDNVAFGQYWFSIKTVKFFNNELLIKLKTVRPVETELLRPYRRPTLTTISKDDSERSDANITESLKDSSLAEEYSGLIDETCQENKEITILDFIKLFQNWALSIKLTTYNFLAQDINKRNIVNTFKFIGLFIVSCVAALIVFVQHLGIYSLRLIFELSRLIKALTPIVLKLIDFVTKIIGGFYILLSMIWRDIFGKRIIKHDNAILPSRPYPRIEYRRSIHSKNFDYDARFRNNYNKKY